MVVGAASLALIGCGGGASRHSGSAGTAALTGRRADAALATRFQHALDTARASIDSPGASAAVLIPGQPLWAGTSGFADVRSHRRVTPGALFEIASVTKTLTAALVLKLTERHVLSLDDHLSRWVPEFPNADRITLRELLAHTAGTGDFLTVAFDRAQRRAGPDSTWPAERTLHYATRPIGGPGRQWSYSNTDYLLLGLVIERATHSTIAEQLHRRLLPRGDFPTPRFPGRRATDRCGRHGLRRRQRRLHVRGVQGPPVHPEPRGSYYGGGSRVGGRQRRRPRPRPARHSGRQPHLRRIAPRDDHLGQNRPWRPRAQPQWVHATRIRPRPRPHPACWAGRVGPPRRHHRLSRRSVVPAARRASRSSLSPTSKPATPSPATRTRSPEISPPS